MPDRLQEVCQRLIMIGNGGLLEVPIGRTNSLCLADGSSWWAGLQQFPDHEAVQYQNLPPVRVKLRRW